MEFRTIRQTSHINGDNRNPGILEHEKAMVWDNDLGKIKYVLYSGQSANSKTTAGFVAKGDDATAGEYIWKLDSSKNPTWRKEEYLKTITRSGNSAIFTMNTGATIEVALGALAWEDTLASAVLSVFGRSGAVLAQTGDYTAAQVTNAFDKLNDSLDDISEGAVNKHFTATNLSNLNANTAARHTHTNKSILDLITNAGGGVIPTADQISEWDTYSDADKLNVIETIVALIQNNAGISWTYDDLLLTLTPEILLSDFTTDDLPEGVINKYYIEDINKGVFTIILPSDSTVAGRCASPIYLPTGWTISSTGSGVDMLINHGLNRYITNVTVFSIDGGTGDERLLLSNAAFSGVLGNSNKLSLIIEALATVPTDIRINLTFE